MIDLSIINCKIAPEKIECCIGVEDGKIVSIKKLPIASDKTIDLKGKTVLPGLIDVHVHLRDPGLTDKEDFRTGTMAAANGGFTTVLDMPNTIPPTNTAAAFRQKKKIAGRKSLVDFGLHAGVGNLDEIEELAKLKPSSFKIFMDLVDNKFLLEAFLRISKLKNNPLISLHAEDGGIIQYCTSQIMKKIDLTPDLYAQARPPLAEIISLSKAIEMAKYIGNKVHICHVSTLESLELIKNARKDNCNISAEITPHHLFLNSSYLKLKGNLAKTNPPLRSDKFKIGLGRLDEIDMMGTDHAPHRIVEKNQDVWDAPPGVPNLETALSLLLTEFNKGIISLKTIKRILCENPALRFGLNSKGFVKEGFDADLVVVDLKKEAIINPDNFKSKAKYSPFEGFEVKGLPVMTLVRGQMVMEDGDIMENKGRFVYD
ncbi:MAG: dihydroorotase family protein [Methanobacteriaceae archaeon]|nr:dihydroorotase family protein [Methanobacteriaceae archaeon]